MKPHADKVTKSLRSRRRALLSESVFDIPPRIRKLLMIIGILGIGIALMEGSVVTQGQTMKLDTIIHFIGYGMVAVVFVLTLRSVLCVPSLVGLVVPGIGLEVLQGYVMHSQEWADVYANMAGIAIGGLFGLIMRSVHAYIREELAIQKVRCSLLRCLPGDVIFHEGQKVEEFFILKTGRVQLSRQIKGESRQMGIAEAGDVFGTISVVLGEPQYTTAVAIERTTLYRMTLDEVLESSDGKELPVSILLVSLTRTLKTAAKKLAAAQIRLD